jgi:hypothetical protein
MAFQVRPGSSHWRGKEILSSKPLLRWDGVLTPSVQPLSFAELKSLTDGELMARLQAGCNDALAILFDRYHRLVRSIALKIVRDSGERKTSCRACSWKFSGRWHNSIPPKALLGFGICNMTITVLCLYLRVFCC